MDWLTSLYLIVGGSAFVLLVLGVVFGFGHDAEVALGVHLDHAEASDGPSWLSVRVLMGALVGFGAFGLIGTGMPIPELASIPVACGGFVLMAIGVKKFILTPMYRQQSNGLQSRSDYVGRTGTIILSVREGSTGRVRFADSGLTLVTETATAADGKEIPNGTAVIVVDVTPEGLVVTPNPLDK